jgi:hypothetical protein
MPLVSVCAIHIQNFSAFFSYNRYTRISLALISINSPQEIERVKLTV